LALLLLHLEAPQRAAVAAEFQILVAPVYPQLLVVLVEAQMVFQPLARLQEELLLLVKVLLVVVQHLLAVVVTTAALVAAVQQRWVAVYL
jgi:hypothetical protein